MPSRPGLADLAVCQPEEQLVVETPWRPSTMLSPITILLELPYLWRVNKWKSDFGNSWSVGGDSHFRWWYRNLFTGCSGAMAPFFSCPCPCSAWILDHSMGTRNWVRIGLSYRPARLHRLAVSFPWNQFMGSSKVLKYRLRSHVSHDIFLLISSLFEYHIPFRICRVNYSKFLANFGVSLYDEDIVHIYTKVLIDYLSWYMIICTVHVKTKDLFRGKLT